MLGFSESCSPVFLKEASLFLLKEGERMSKWQPHGFPCNYICRSFEYPSRILNVKAFLENVILDQLLVVLIYTLFNDLLCTVRRIILPPESSIFSSLYIA